MTFKGRLTRLEARATAKQAPSDVFSVFLENPADPERTREAYERLTLSPSGYPIFIDEMASRL